MEVALKGYPQDRTALTLRQQALQRLMEKAGAGTRNDYEIYWLKYRLADTAARLEGESTP